MDVEYQCGGKDLDLYVHAMVKDGPSGSRWSPGTYCRLPLINERRERVKSSSSDT